MKGRLISFKDISTDYERRHTRNRTQIPKGRTRMEKIIEIIAKAWIVCDPNRQPSSPDDPIEIEGGTMNGEPEWKWFIPRAQATIKFLEENGYEIKKKP